MAQQLSASYPPDLTQQSPHSYQKKKKIQDWCLSILIGLAQVTCPLLANPYVWAIYIPIGQAGSYAFPSATGDNSEAGVGPQRKISGRQSVEKEGMQDGQENQQQCIIQP